LVEQHQVVRLAAGERERVVAVRRGVDVVAALPQKQQMRLEQLHLVVDPEDPLLGWLHSASFQAALQFRFTQRREAAKPQRTDSNPFNYNNGNGLIYPPLP